MSAKAFTIVVAVVYSPEGGDQAHSTDKATCIDRIKEEVARRAAEAIPEGMQCSLVSCQREDIVQ